MEAQGGITITSPASNGQKFKAGPDFATDVMADPWDFGNREDVTLDPAQIDGFANFQVAGGVAGGTLTTAAASGSNSASHFYTLQRPWYNILNPGRNGRRYPIATSTYKKLAFKMGTVPGSQSDAGQNPRVYWFHNDIGDPSGDGSGWLYVDPNVATPSGANILVVDLTQVNQNGINQGVPWTAGNASGFGFYPNSSRVGYNVQFDWVRITTADSDPASAMMTISWSGGSGTVNIDVTDAAGTNYRVRTNAGASGSFQWNYGILPPGNYTLKIGTTATRTFTVNNPPLIQVTDPDESGGDDFATDVLQNPWDMNDPNDVVTSVNVIDNLTNKVFNGVFTATTSNTAGDPEVYLLSTQKTSQTSPVIDSTKYHRLTFDLQVDHPFDLANGSVARVFWGSASSNTGGGTPYNVTTSKDIITWPGKNTYSVDLATLTAGVNGGLEPANATPWTQNAIRHLRIDPFELNEIVTFHIDNVKLAADDATKNGSFVIRWAGSDADGDPSTVSLYYDTDRNPGSGLTPIVSGIALGLGQYTWNTGSVPNGTYYIYAIVSDAWNASAQYSTGPIRVGTVNSASNPLINVDTPQPGQVLTSAFEVGGWVVDLGAGSGPGIDDVQFYVHPNSIGTPGIFIGHGRYGLPRGDVGATFGGQFTNSGYHYTLTGMSPGSFVLEVQAHSTVTNAYSIIKTLPFSVSANALMSIDAPSAESAIGSATFGVSGWAIDRRVESTAQAGTGIDQVHVYAYPNPGSGQPPIFLGVGQYGVFQRPDVAGVYGSRYTNSGYVLNINRTASGLTPGTYNIVVWVHSTVDNTFIANALVQIVLQ